MLAQPLDYFREEAFAEPDADRLLFGEDVEDLLSRLAQGGPSGPTGEAGEPWPLTPLGQAEERALFRALNYAKSRADELRQELNPRRYVPSGVLRRIEALRGRAETLRERLVRAHLPLAAQVARQHAGAGAGFQETYARARTQLGHLVETFDYRGRARFPRYASLELMKAFARAATPQAGDDA
ncbi:MAG: hypothetical protein AMK73_06490 [Planctomycetes bacterium SM23_32]|nr:MAG: hypothetical protein AMK73_06490 [Planctomycetes bacterium SM23_32]